MNAGDLPAVAALSMGLATAISPCPLATNIAAVAYVSRRFTSLALVVGDTIMYTIGRALSYTLLGLIVRELGLQVADVARPLITVGEYVLGPLLILVGVFLFGIVKLPTFGGGGKERVVKMAGRVPLISSFLLGFAFALAFCPFSAAIFFGGLIPLALSAPFGRFIPLLYGTATALPVLIVGLLLALGLEWTGKVINGMTKLERWTRPLLASIFILVGAWQIFVLVRSHL